jgi:hypothetical protein
MWKIHENPGLLMTNHGKTDIDHLDHHVLPDTLWKKTSFAIESHHFE